MAIEVYLSGIAILISVISLIVSLYFRFGQKAHNKEIRGKVDLGLSQAKKAIEKSGEAIEVSRDGFEHTITREINLAKYKLHEVAQEISQFQPDSSKKDLLRYEQLFKAAVESLLNQYEILCGYYLANRINKERFRKQKHLEIKQIVEDEATREYFQNPEPETYQSIIQVYNELKGT